MKESEMQAMVFEWAAWSARQWPELQLMYHVPNGGGRNLIEAAHLKRQGVKAGVPDICLPVARGKYNGMYVELKSKNGKLSEKQDEWIKALNDQGYYVRVCYSWEQAVGEIAYYLELGEKKNAVDKC